MAATLSSNAQPFDDFASPAQSELDRVAASAVATSVRPGSNDMLVLAVRPADDRRRVIASEGNSAIRAAVSVAVAADNLRAWAGTETGAVIDVPVAALPEIIRSSVQPTGMNSVRVGAVRVGMEIACLTMWLSPQVTPDAAARDAHEHVLELLRAAAERDRAARAAASAAAPLLDTIDLDGAAAAAPGTAMLDRDEFEDALDEVESDAVGVLVLGVDTPLASPTRDAVAARIASHLRRGDVAAVLDDESFAVLFVDIDRKTAFEIAKRLRSGLTEPLLTPSGVVELVFSAGFSHETGLVDTVDMFERAQGAMEDARDQGGNLMLVAS